MDIRKYLELALLGTLLSTSYISAAAVAEEEEELLYTGMIPLVLILGHEEKTGVLYNELKASLKAKTSPIVVSSDTFIHFIQQYTADKSTNLVKDLKQNARRSYWHIYENKDKDFVLLIPSHFFGKSLTDLGFDENNFIQIKNKEVVDEFDARIIEKKIPNLPHLKSLFTTQDSVSKIIYAIGHGQISGTQLGKKPGQILHLPQNEYRELLEFFNKINVQFLLVISCFAGGLNAFEAYSKMVNGALENVKLNYFTMVLSLGDAEVTQFASYEPRLDDFFELVANYISPSGPKKTNAIAEIAKTITRGFLASTPLLRFPGAINYFKVVDFDKKIEIITYAKATAKKLENKPFIIKDKQAVLLYPAVVRVPIKLYQAPISEEDMYAAQKYGFIQLTPIISMIPGNAYHLLQELIIENGTLESFVRGMFIPDIQAWKGFYIKKLTARPGDAIKIDSENLPKINPETAKKLLDPQALITLSNVALLVSSLAGGLLTFKLDDYYFTANLAEKTGIIRPLKLITKEMAESEMLGLAKKLKMDPQILRHASGGQEIDPIEELEQLFFGK